jgi:putative addiction module killer protein
LDFGPGYRVYFATVKQVIVVLVLGGDKSTQDKDIAKAQQLWQENKDDAERFQRSFGA